jgi:hypothetical protein
MSLSRGDSAWILEVIGTGAEGTGMLKRIANIFVDHAARGAGAVVGVRMGHDAYNWVKSGKATAAVKKLANSAADTTSELLGAQKEAEAPRRIARPEEEASERVRVACERCGEPALVRLGAGDVVVTCPGCEARFWVDTDELAKKRRQL